MNIKMIVTDLDNTLLRHDKTVSDFTVDVFRRIRERGALIVFATARDFRFVTEYITPMNGIAPDILIADNGALARYNDKDLYKKLIPFETLNTLISRYDLIRCISTERGYYLSGNYTNDHWSLGKKETVITNLSQNTNEDALYIDGNTNKAPSSLTENIPDIRVVTYSDVSLVTVVHREATKLNALNATCNALKVKINETVIFGDDYSDIEMLSNCTNSVAVANAIDECKAVAKYICDTNENDGVAKWLESFVLE